jgi:hypothetical protein
MNDVNDSGASPSLDAFVGSDDRQLAREALRPFNRIQAPFERVVIDPKIAGVEIEKPIAEPPIDEEQEAASGAAKLKRASKPSTLDIPSKTGRPVGCRVLMSLSRYARTYPAIVREGKTLPAVTIPLGKMSHAEKAYSSAEKKLRGLPSSVYISLSDAQIERLEGDPMFIGEMRLRQYRWHVGKVEVLLSAEEKNALLVKENRELKKKLAQSEADVSTALDMAEKGK